MDLDNINLNDETENLDIEDVMDNSCLQAILDAEEDCCAECHNLLSEKDDHDVCWSCIMKTTEEVPKPISQLL